MPKQLTIAIDFDGTWTADADAWLSFYKEMTDRGHTIIIVTGREIWTSDMSRHCLPDLVRIVFCNNKPKEQEAIRNGYKVDIWIDDNPGSIQPFKFLQEAEDKEL